MKVRIKMFVARDADGLHLFTNKPFQVVHDGIPFWHSQEEGRIDYETMRIDDAFFREVRLGSVWAAYATINLNSRITEFNIYKSLEE